nr:feruloyl-CoA 6'-hydroxylase [Clematis terniflora]
MAPTIPNPTDINDFVVKKGNGVKGLSNIGFESIPEQYIQPMEQRLDMKTVSTEASIPIIDMSKYHDDPSVLAELVCHAAETWGFFQLINHGVPNEVLESVKEATNCFFGLSAGAKNKYTQGNSPTKSVRYGTSFVPKAEKSMEWKDYLSLFYTSQEEADAFWPKECKDQVLEYMKCTEPVVKRLLDVLMKKIHVKEIDERKYSLLMGSARINLNYYPVCPNPELTVGIGRHSDVSTLTVLLQDNIGGLYVRGLAEDNWVHVPPIEGSLVINVGDALQILSNGHYKSIEHRVVANGRNNRISIPIFFNPKPNDFICPLVEVTEKGEEAVYKEVLYSDYVKHFFKKAHDGKKTIDFAKI